MGGDPGLARAPMSEGGREDPTNFPFPSLGTLVGRLFSQEEKKTGNGGTFEWGEGLNRLRLGQ